MRIILIVLGLFIGGILVTAKPARAVLPPDFIFNISGQIIQIFSLSAVFLAAGMTTVHQFFKDKLGGSKWLILPGVAFVFVVSLGVAYLYGNHQQQEETKKWLEESKAHEIVKVVVESTPSPTPQKQEDTVFTFVRAYYAAISAKDWEKAYAMSKKSVDLATFKSRYEKTTGIMITQLIRIDETRMSLELVLDESGVKTAYQVLLTLTMKNGQPKAIEKSEVKVLTASVTAPVSIEKEAEALSNESLKKILAEKRNDFIVLDAREDIEYENGYFPESIHIRFADLKAGRWVELPSDKKIYIFCWSGIRGKEVSTFLRSKNLAAYYMESGTNGWVQAGGRWQGSIAFSSKYGEPRFQLVFSTSEVKKKVGEGVVLVDCREPEKFQSSAIEGSFSLPIMYTPTINLTEAFGKIPSGSTVITVCDGYVNCFDAKITGVELEKRGYTFIGRYNKPWEYGK